MSIESIKFPKLNPQKPFQTLIDEALTEYERIYQPSLVSSTALSEYETKWGEWKTDLIAGKLNPAPNAKEIEQKLEQYVQTYVPYRNTRDNLKKIQTLFDTTIAQLQPPQHLDVPTLNYLSGLGLCINQKENSGEMSAESQHQKLLKELLPQLEEKRKQISMLWVKYNQSGIVLRSILEEIANYKNGTWTILQLSKQVVSGSWTPEINTMIQAETERLKKIELSNKERLNQELESGDVKLN